MTGRRLTIVASSWWERQSVLPGCHGWPTVMQCKSLCICFQPGVGVGGPHLPEGVQEAPAEVPHASEALPELLVENDPGEELGLLRRNAVQPLRQPDVNVQ